MVGLFPLYGKEQNMPDWNCIINVDRVGTRLPRFLFSLFAEEKSLKETIGPCKSKVASGLKWFIMEPFPTEPKISPAVTLTGRSTNGIPISL